MPLVPPRRRRLLSRSPASSTSSSSRFRPRRPTARSSTADLLAAIEAQRGIKIERGQFSLEDSLKEVGEYEAVIDLGQGVTAKCKITINDEAAA